MSTLGGNGARRDGPLVIGFAGELDCGRVNEIRMQFDAVARRGITVYDLSAVTFIDSVALRAIIAAHKLARAAGGELRLVVRDPRVHRIFAVTSMDRWLNIYDTLELALAGRPGRAKL